MGVRHGAFGPCLPLLILYPVLLTAQNENDTAEDPIEGGVKLAAWHISEFSIYFSVILTLLGITLFKMYYPKVPYVPDYIPQSLLLIVIGVIFGAILNAITHQGLENTLWKLSPDMFFHFLLPPIVLDAAYSLYNRTFLDYLGSILIYAVVGTVLNFLIIGPLMYGLDVAGAMGSKSVDITFNAYLLFASLIVAVDPVAVLAIFQDIGVEPGLYYMVFGESLLNDAVTVVLYRIMSEFVGVTNVDGAQIGLGIGSFFTISFGGLIVGVIIGLITSLFTRWTGHFGCFLIMLMAYFSYIFGETVGWSGIISMIGCGLVQADYAFHNISSSALTSVRLVIKEIAEVSEAFIFFLIGVQLFSAEIEWNTGFCLWGMVVCLIARAIAVLLLTFIINWINVNNLRVTFKQQAILIYGGLRGAVAFSLGLLVENQELGPNGVHVRKTIVTGTLFIILFTVGLMGLTMKPLVKLFHIKLAGKEELSLFGDLNGNVLDHVLAGVEAMIGSNGRNRIRVFFTRLDDRFTRRWLQRNPETHDERIVRTYENIALKLHYATIKPSKSSSYLQGLPETIRQKHMLESGDSTLHLPSLAVSLSDSRLLEYFTSGQNQDSSTNLNAQSQESIEDLHGHKVTFDNTVDLDNAEAFVGPQWRRKSGVIDKGGEGNFEKEFFSVLRSKARASRILRLRKHKAKTSDGRSEDGYDEDSELERRRAQQTAENTAKNRLATQPGRVNTTSTSLASTRDEDQLPPRDYPYGPGKDITPKFRIGDDD
ncbi:sodium:hydrogen exchanger 2 nhe2 [Echinococcus multilocularis]|uniref:Sodium/hydrogen exchanger n=1 Tax=Echinococcus multilocularis TaxID=6211 RepID=A0A068YFQ4_ECHMU|nr:sodium:hydrogen exchanger 2 nhe2 [Echinococcus multilocularis]